MKRLRVAVLSALVEKSDRGRESTNVAAQLVPEDAVHVHMRAVGRPHSFAHVGLGCDRVDEGEGAESGYTSSHATSTRGGFPGEGGRPKGGKVERMVQAVDVVPRSGA